MKPTPEFAAFMAKYNVFPNKEGVISEDILLERALYLLVHSPRNKEPVFLVLGREPESPQDLQSVLKELRTLQEPKKIEALKTIDGLSLQEALGQLLYRIDQNRRDI